MEELYIFLQGNATLCCPLRGERPWQCGEAIGEAAFAGTTRLYPARVTADTVCLIQVPYEPLKEPLRGGRGRGRSTSGTTSSKPWPSRRAAIVSCGRLEAPRMTT